MTLPTKTYTWEFKLNQGLNGYLYDYDGAQSETGISTQGYLLWMIKEALKDSSTFTSPWVVKGSSDKYTAGAMDNVDRWTDAAKVKEGSTNHSWIVLEQAGLGGSQLLIDLINTYNYASAWAYRRFSTDKFDTGGTQSAAPTSSGVTVTMSGQSGHNWCDDSYSFQNYMFYLNTAMSTNGEMTISWIWAGNDVRFIMILAKIKNAHASQTRPYICYWPDINGVGARAGNADFFESNYGHSEINGVDSSIVFPTHGYSSNYVTELDWAGGVSRNDFTGEYMMWPMHIACENVGQRGWFGQLPDVYNAPYNSITPQGAMTSGKEWVKVGGLWLPWDGSTTPLTA